MDVIERFEEIQIKEEENSLAHDELNHVPFGNISNNSSTVEILDKLKFEYEDHDVKIGITENRNMPLEFNLDDTLHADKFYKKNLEDTLNLDKFSVKISEETSNKDILCKKESEVKLYTDKVCEQNQNKQVQDFNKQIYFCSYCDKGFKFKYDLKSHLLSHLENTEDFIEKFEDIQTEKEGSDIKYDELNHFLYGNTSNISSFDEVLEMKFDEHDVKKGLLENTNGSFKFNPKRTIRSDMIEKISKEGLQSDNFFGKNTRNIQYISTICEKNPETHKENIFEKNPEAIPHTVNCKKNLEIPLYPSKNRQGYKDPNKMKNLVIILHDIKYDLKLKSKIFKHKQEENKIKVARHFCKYCDKSWESKSDLTRHLVVHTGKKRFICKYCNQKFSFKGNLVHHIKIHTRGNPFNCSLCNEKFATEGYLKKHMIKSHEDYKPHKCSVCGVNFKHKSQLTKHYVQHTTGKLECAHCQKRCHTKSSLIMHIRVHGYEGEKLYSCTFCNTKFHTPGYLKSHLRVHTKEKPYNCPLCEKRFSHSQALSGHIRTHTGEKPFQCLSCDKSFRRQNDLSRHTRIHTKDKRYFCNICDKKFIRVGHLKSHMLTHSGQKKVECTECKRRFTTKFQLKIHMRTHTGEKPYKCSHCNKQFTHSGTLKIHSYLHTGEKPYSCKLCNKKFRQLPHLKGHNLRNH